MAPKLRPDAPSGVESHARLAAAWRAYRAGVCDASRTWSRLSPGEVIEVRAQLDALRAEVFAAEASCGSPGAFRPAAAGEKGATQHDDA